MMPLAPRTARSAVEPAPHEMPRELLRLVDEVAEAGRALRVALDEKERLARLLDQVLEHLDAAVVLRRSDGSLIAANRAAQQLGVVKDGRLHESLLQPIEAETVRPDGPQGRTWVARRCSLPLLGADESELWLITDVSAWVELQRGANRKTRLEAVGRMAAELAHEVRNPLGSLELFASMLSEDLVDRPAQQELADQIVVGVRRLSNVVSKLLGAVRGGGAPKRSVPLEPLCASIVSFAAPLAEAKQIELRCELETDARVDADVDSLHQALLNLIGNALEATPERGSIVLRASQAAGECRLEVHDSGPGIAPELRERVFEPMFTTSPRGTGLGLAVVERVAIEHGGRAEISDSFLGGAMVAVVVPLREGSA